MSEFQIVVSVALIMKEGVTRYCFVSLSFVKQKKILCVKINCHLLPFLRACPVWEPKNISKSASCFFFGGDGPFIAGI